MSTRRRTSRRCTAGLLALLLGGLSGCQGLGLWRGERCPVALVDSARIPPGRLQLRMRMDALARTQAPDSAGTPAGAGLELVVEVHGGIVTIVGFTPFGTRAFALRQHGTRVEVDDRATRYLGFQPIWVLDALQRARWIQPPEAQGGAPVLRFRHGDERVVDSGEASGFPRVRTYRQGADRARGDRTDGVRIEYAAPDGRDVTVRNPWCGYEAQIAAPP